MGPGNQHHVMIMLTPKKVTKHLFLDSIPSICKISVSGVGGTDLQRA